MKKKIKNILIVMIIFFAILLVFSAKWVYSTFEGLTMSEIVFHLKVPLAGTNPSFVYDYIKRCVPQTLIITIVLSFLLVKDFSNLKYIDKIKYIIKKVIKKIIEIIKKILSLIKKYNIVSAMLIFAICLSYIWKTTDIGGYINSQLKSSFLIEDEYVNPNDVKISFEGERRNLIYIFLESMENTFSSIDENGGFSVNLIPELTEIAKENINFSNTETLGGAVVTPYTTWTIAAMVAQTSGLPLKLSIEGNSYGEYSTFLPGVTSLGEVLEKEGYSNYLMVGSDAAFAGRKNYFEQHGNYEIWDLNTAINENRMTMDDYVWWGVDDNDLFKYAKERLTEISKNEEPFNFTMLTVDTHHVDGYVCEYCEEKYNEQYSNVIACSSRQVGAFVKWIQKQDFYENTTIVISGDHRTMEPDYYFEQMQLNENYDRTTYNAIINAKIEPLKEKNRIFSSMDMFPTTLVAIGATIEGDRLGIGTNLFSNRETLHEQYGRQYVTDELEKTSVFYNKKFI